MSRNQRLNAVITIGAAMAASVNRTVGAVNSQLRRIGGGFSGVEGAQANLGRAMDRTNASLDRARMGVLDAVGAFYALQGAIGAPVRAAVEFESAMADVRKVVDFPTPEGFDAFRDQLVGLSKEIPTSVVGLTQIAAAAGQAGIAGDDLVRFTEAAAKIGVAFDISADEAGTAMAKLGTGLGLTIDETVRLADAMNHLSNSQAATAGEILDVVRRVGAQGTQFGFTAEQTAAFASAMIAAGAESDVAATSFANMGRALTRGASATTRQRGALQQLGLDAEEVARSMQENAVGTTLAVMRQIGELPAEMRAAVSSDLFGDEARALGPLLTQLDLVQESLGLVADEAGYAGSAFREFDVRSNTTGSKFQTFRNRLEAVQITIGEALVPALVRLMEVIEPVIERIGQFVEQYPDLAANVMLGVGALIAFRGAVAAIQFAGLLGKAGALHALSAGMAAVGKGGGGLAAAAREAIGLQAALAAMGGQRLTALQRVGAGFAGVARAVPGVALMGKAVAAIGAGVATISAPVWGAFAAVAVAVGAAGAAIYRHWDRITSTLSGVAQRIGEELAPAFEAMRPVIDWFAPAAAVIGSAWSGAADAISAAWSGARESIGAVWEWLTGIFERDILTDDQKAQAEASGYDFADRIIVGIKSGIGGMIDAGRALVQSLWDGMVERFGEFIGWVKSIPGRIIDAIGNIDLSGVITMPSLPSWLGGGEAPAPGALPAGSYTNPASEFAGVDGFADGGTFRKGPILVGERGPELRFESRAGFIATNRQLREMARRAAQVAAAVGGIGAATLPAAAQNVVSIPAAAVPSFAREAGPNVSIPAAAAPSFTAEPAREVSVPAAAAPEFAPEAPARVSIPAAAAPKFEREAPAGVNIPAAAAPSFTREAAESVAVPAAAAPQFDQAAPDRVSIPAAAAPSFDREMPAPVIIPAAAAPSFAAEPAAPVTIPAATAPQFDRAEPASITIPASAAPEIDQEPPARRALADAPQIRTAAAQPAQQVKHIVQNLGGITIHAAPGMDPRAIADAVIREIERRGRGALYDGGAF